MKYKFKDIMLKELYGNIDNFAVYIVDGEYVRNHFDSDFEEGSNCYAHPEYVSQGEIWLEKGLEKEYPFILGHELTEAKLMRDEGMTYDEAHDRAKREEDERRRASQTFQKNQQSILRSLKAKGIKQEHLETQGWMLSKQEYNFAIESDPGLESKWDTSKYKVLYRYEGPRDDKNRPFCANVLDADLLYRKEDIDMMSFRQENMKFGTYSIFKYKGSYNCRHNWQRLVFEKSSGKETTNVPEVHPADVEATQVNIKVK